jgi:hypothetical protein
MQVGAAVACASRGDAASRPPIEAVRGGCPQAIFGPAAEFAVETSAEAEIGAGSLAPDHFERLKMLQDADAILADCRDLIEQHGLDVEATRQAIKAMLDERPMPLRGAT